MWKYIIKTGYLFCMLLVLGSWYHVKEYIPVSADVGVVERKKIALTFDDGPNRVFTPQLLDALKERNVKATFFMIGKYAKENPEVVKRAIEEGHIVGNHTYSHVNLRTISLLEAVEEIERTNQILQEVTGQNVEYLRPPFGEGKEDILDATGMISVLWSVDPLDWKTSAADEIVKKVVTDVEENDIILLHDCYESSVNAAIQIIDILMEEGYEFVTVEELILD